MTSQPAVKRRARMFSANEASLVNAVANPSSAPGARSWRISSIAVPSSPSPSWPVSTSTSGSSPAASEAASESTPSESAHNLTPVPVTRRVARAASAACALSPSETTAPWLGAAIAAATARCKRAARAALGARLPGTAAGAMARAVMAPTAGSIRSTARHAAIRPSAASGSSARTASCARDACRTRPPAASRRSTRSLSSATARTSTSTVRARETATPLLSRGMRESAGARRRSASATASRLSSLRSAGDWAVLSACRAAICSAAAALS